MTIVHQDTNSTLHRGARHGSYIHRKYVDLYRLPVWVHSHRLDGKRKASDQPDDVAWKKRIKNSHTVTPEKEKRPSIVPFPEKVRNHLCSAVCEV